MSKELTTPKAILIGMSLIAVAIASIPYSKSVVTEAHAASGVQKVQICGYSYNKKLYCAGVGGGDPVSKRHGSLYTSK
jgi:hypothetical protein